MSAKELFIKTEYLTFAAPPREFVLESGEKLGPITLAYETYGELNAKKSNAILIFHALSGDAHAAGRHHPKDKKPGWWDILIGPGKTFDTNKYFVICANVIGGCKGSTGPSSVDPKTGNPYALSFPFITLKDMVRAQKTLLDHLGIKRLFATAGGSMGGMQALEWAVTYPEATYLTIVMGVAAYQSAQNIAFHEVGRRAITADPNWNKGNYYNSGKEPVDGLALARMIGHITYLSDETMRQKFGRERQEEQKPKYVFAKEFKVESYLDYQGEVFTKRFDANSYLYITKAIDYFDLKRGRRSLAEVFREVKAKFLAVSFSSDWLYPKAQTLELVEALKYANIDTTYFELKTSAGHDAFLLEKVALEGLLMGYLDNSFKKMERKTA